ncbi:dehydrase and lipid transport-domain-containing protein [Lasiosphaeria miniovina]|uniref:Dehydrase and lipid transport-domain-containing protein n=1 Tax=Lasiosphaeria miniovina TaxID=1954250 RepID=A0AA40B5T6_9PEZI|nr:dehydrase and lipid transport-domain-containing protein [Lasiosphaeria miniovina]KAK0728202.1 dehydrase and lipid transport-domain-containing protein [Lasiosphaeria miniovina]
MALQISPSPARRVLASRVTATAPTSFRAQHTFSSLPCRRALFSSLHNTPRLPPHSPPRLSRRPSATPHHALQPRPSQRHSSSWLLSALPHLLPGSSTNSVGPSPTPTPTTTLRARRTLPYPPAQIYALIADIDAYRLFLPHCTSSKVTAWTSPAPSPPSQPSPHTPSPAPSETSQQQKRKWPARADLTVGWGPFTQSYTSWVYCEPGRAVEAVSGSGARTTIPAATLAEHGYSSGFESDGDDMAMAGVFESLVTRWTVRPVTAPGSGSAALPQNNGADGSDDGCWTEVSLSVRFQFANPALGYAMGQLADNKVDEMVQAFEDRARALYGPGSSQ